MKIAARVSDENKLDQFIGDFTFDVHVASATKKPNAATADVARRKLIAEMRKYDCEILEFYDCYFKQHSCDVFVKARFKSLAGVKRRLFGESRAEHSDADAIEIMRREQIEQPKTHAWLRRQLPERFYDYPANVNARVASEVRRFPRKVLVFYNAGMTRHGSEITEATIAQKVRVQGGKLKKLRGLFLDTQHLDVRPKAHVQVIALIDVELATTKNAHKFFENAPIWVDPIIDPNNKKMSQLAGIWTDNVPEDENELTIVLDAYERCVNIALKDKLVKTMKPIAKPVTARVSSEKSALKPLVIPKFWFMNNSPHGTRPLNTLIKDDMAWLKSKGINNVTPVRAVARTFGGDGMAARYVMAVAYRLELSPREMIDYTDGMVRIESPIETEDDIAAFWKEQAVKHAKTEKRYMDDKQYPDLKVFDIVKSHGRWTLGLADKAVASVANRHGFSVAARVGREYDAAHAWHVLINDAARDWPIKVNMFYLGHPRDELFNPFRQIDPDLKVQRSDGGSTRKPLTCVICNVRDSDAALRFALAKLKQDEFPEIDGSKESRWFAHEVVEALGKHNFKHDSDLIEYADHSKLNSPAPIGLMARLRKLIGL